VVIVIRVPDSRRRQVALSYDVFQVPPKPIPSRVPGFEDQVGQATWPPSTATFIWNEDGGLLIDALITRAESELLAKWVADHDGPLTTVYVTHPHADHFLGLPAVLAAFPDAKAVALPGAIPGLQAQVSPAAMQVWGGFFPSQLPTEPIVPEALSGDSIPIGDAVATLIEVGATDTDNSSVVHVPELHLVVAGDVVYNRVHMWLARSTPESRASWLRALETVETLGASTIIAGHRHPDAPDDDARRQVQESRRYLADIEGALEASATPQELINQMTERYPDLGNPYTLWVAAFDLLSASDA
jgi:glyoxylase-like metal-dependent hydrolase (beta-lactamase superfamily II)